VTDEPDADPAASDPDADDEHRREHVTRYATPGPGNSLARWTDAKHPLRVALNYLLVWLVRIAPSLRVRRWGLSAVGVTVGDGVSWGLEATPDVFWPEHVTLGEDVIVGYDAVLLCHEFLQDEYRVGDVVVGDRAMIGAKATVLPGVEIGADAQVAANSLVAEDVPPGATVAGVPAEVVSEGDRAASDSDGGEPEDPAPAEN